MSDWPRVKSPTGRGFTQGPDSYSPVDVAREEREREKEKKDQEREREQEIRHVYSDDDPNFGDYNIPPGGNHP